jgi:peptide/nickel transport system substrate-binding protein
MRHFALLLPLAVLALGLSGSPAEAQPQNLVLQSATEPPGLDLTATPASATVGVVFYNVQEGLTKVDRHGKIVPWLAERWHTTDNKNYTFFLKRGVRFHNGRELRAADVKFVFDRAMNPETKHPAAGNYAAIADIIVKDDYTVTFALKTTTANFLLNISRQGSVIYPREAVDSLKSEPVGTGPYKLAEWVRGDRIVLVKHPDYHVKGLPKLDRVTFRFIPDPNAALAALKAGDVDASLFGLGPEHIPDLQKDPRFQAIIGETTNDVIMSMNNSRKPFTDVRVRRAITYAINKPEVVKGAMFGLGRVIGTNVDPLNPYYVDMAGEMPHDPAKAKKLLAEAGYSGGFEAVLRVAPQYYYTVRTGEVLASQLQKVGVKVRIEQIEWGPVALARVEGRRLRPHHHRARRGVGHRQLRQPEVLLPLRQRGVPEALPGVGGDCRRQGAPRALREDAEEACRGRAGGVALHSPAAGRDQERAAGLLERPARRRRGGRSLRGRVDEIAGASA